MSKWDKYKAVDDVWDKYPVVTEEPPTQSIPDLYDKAERAYDFADANELDPMFVAENFDAIERIEKKRPIGFVDGVKQDALYKVPFVGPALQGIDLLGLREDAVRLNDEEFDWDRAAEIETFRERRKRSLKTWTGDSLKQRAVDNVNDYITEMADRQERGMNIWGKIGSGLSILPGWMFEFAMTAGLYKTASAPVKKVLQNHMKTKLLARTAGWATGSAVRTTVGMPHRVFANTMRQSLHNDEGWATSLAKGWGETFIEVASEEAGEGLVGGAKWVAGGAVNKLPFGKKFLGALQSAWTKLSPNNTAAEFTKRVATKAGYNGLIGEFGEERLATIMHAIAKTETFGLPAGADIEDRILAGLKQDFDASNLLAEGVVLSVPGAIKVSIAHLGELAGSKLAKAVETQVGVSPNVAQKAVELKATDGVAAADAYLSQVKTEGEAAANDALKLQETQEGMERLFGTKEKAEGLPVVHPIKADAKRRPPSPPAATEGVEAVETPEEAKEAERTLELEGAEVVKPNLYIGNVTPGLKKRMSEAMGIPAQDIQGFKDGAFPTRRTETELTRSQAEEYLDWLETDLDRRFAANEINTENQLAWANADYGDIKTLRNVLGMEPSKRPFTVIRAEQRNSAEMQAWKQLAKRYAALRKIENTDDAEGIAVAEALVAEGEQEYMKLVRALGEPVKFSKTKGIIKESIRPTQESKMTVGEVLRAVLKRSARFAKMAHQTGRAELRADIRAKARAKKRVSKAIKTIKQKVPRSVDFFYREAIDSLREGIDVARRSEKTLARRQATRDFIARNPDRASEIPIKLMKQIGQKPLNDFTIEELEDVATEITNLVEKGKLKRELSQKQKAKKLDTTKDAIVGAITKGESLKIESGPKVFSTTRDGLVKTATQKTRAWTLRPSRIFDMLDGRKNFSGPNHSFFVDTTNRVTDTKWRKTDKRIDAGKAKQKQLGIDAKGLAQVRVVNDVRYTVDEMIDVYAGNKNRLKKLALLYGNNFEQSDIDAVIAALTDNEKAWADFVIQDYADNYERLRNEVIEIENRDMGQEENYTPIRRTELDYSTHTEEIIAEILQKENLRKAYAAKGFTIERKNIPAEFQKPIRLGLTSMWLSQVPKQEQYINLAQHIRDMHRVVDSAEFGDAVKQRFGNEFNKVIKDYINRVANPNIYRTFSSLENTSRWLRQNAAVAYLAYNLVTMAKQLPSVLLYLPDAGGAHLLSSAGEFVAHPLKTIQMVRELDPQVKHKAIERELEELRNAHGNVYTQVVRMFGRMGMHGIYMMDTIARTIGWNAVYQKAMASDLSEAEAIRLAQNATLRTQPSAAAQDLPALYATSEFAHWFTMFTNQLNQIYNIGTYDVPSYIANAKYGDAALASIGMAATALVIWAMTHKDIPDEPEDFLEAAEEQIINSVPLFGKAIMAERRGWGNSGIPAFESGKVVARLLEAAKTRELTTNEMKTIVEGMAVSLGVPYIGPKRVIEAAQTGEASRLLGGKQKQKKREVVEY